MSDPFLIFSETGCKEGSSGRFLGDTPEGSSVERSVAGPSWDEIWEEWVLGRGGRLT